MFCSCVGNLHFITLVVPPEVEIANDVKSVTHISREEEAKILLKDQDSFRTSMR